MVDQLNELKALAAQFRTPAFPGSYFLSFEGIEGAGKSTQIVRIKEALEEKQFRVLILREPGGTPYGEKLRQAILNSTTSIHPVAEMHLFASSRAQLHHEVTLKELAVPNTIIIYDRYIDSSMAYQGVGRGLGIKSVLAAHQDFPLNLMPHLTFYLKIDPQLSQRRQKMRNAPKDYFESKGPEFYQKLVEGYETAVELFPQRISVIDGTQNEETVFTQVMGKIENLIYAKEAGV
jgi:dTMP kinase